MSEPSIPTIEPSQASASGNGAGPRRLRLGGMALRNGLLIHGPTSWAAAARAGRMIKVARAEADVRAYRGRAVASRSLKLAEAFAVVPLARRKLPGGAVAVRGSAVLTTAIAATVAGNLCGG